MNQLANAFGSKFTENKDSLRIKSFELNGHTFRVKVPLTAETDAMFERVKSIDEAKANQFYQEMSKEFIENRVKYENDPDIKYLEDDIEVKETSIKETSRNKVLMPMPWARSLSSCAGTSGKPLALRTSMAMATRVECSPLCKAMKSMSKGGGKLSTQ